jgi:hypothetical protein
MNIETAKYDIIKSVINLKDMAILRKIMQLLEQSQLKPVNRMSLEEFYERIEASEKAYKSGQVTSHDDLKKEVRTWGKNI